MIIYSHLRARLDNPVQTFYETRLQQLFNGCDIDTQTVEETVPHNVVTALWGFTEPRFAMLAWIYWLKVIWPQLADCVVDVGEGSAITTYQMAVLAETLDKFEVALMADEPIGVLSEVRGRHGILARTIIENWSRVLDETMPPEDLVETVIDRYEDIDNADIERLYENFYRCPSCGNEWTDVWTAMSDDTCPQCGRRNVQPYESRDIGPAEPGGIRTLNSYDCFWHTMLELLVETEWTSRLLRRWWKLVNCKLPVLDVYDTTRLLWSNVKADAEAHPLSTLASYFNDFAFQQLIAWPTPLDTPTSIAVRTVPFDVVAGRVEWDPETDRFTLVPPPGVSQLERSTFVPDHNTDLNGICTVLANYIIPWGEELTVDL